MEVYFSSKTDLWATPQDFFDRMNAEFRFDLDVCGYRKSVAVPATL
jgi:hypothetical protein